MIYKFRVILDAEEDIFRDIAIESDNTLEDLHNAIVKISFYYHQCSIEMTCVDLAKCSQVFANNGVIPKSDKKFLSTSKCKRMNALMQMCGFYDQAGEFTFKVGLPGKT